MSKKKKILIFSSSERSTLEVINVVKEIKKRNHDFFFLYSNSTDTQYPTYSLENFSYDTNIENPTPVYSAKTLGNITLPFIPDVLLVSRENWEPEKSIFIEFKQLGTLICCIENSSWLYSEIESKLELRSRKNFPTNLIDVFFDHSDWTFDTKVLASWVTHKTKIVGTSKYDDLVNIEPYNKTKPVIIIYGSMNSFMHQNILQKTKHIVNEFKDQYEIFYKPHPVEFNDFKEDFTNNSTNLNNIPNVNVIKDEKVFQSIVKSSDINIGILSSIMYYPLVLNKKVVLFDLNASGLENAYNIEKFQGKLFEFWAPIVKVNSFEEFKQLVGEKFLNETIKRKNNLMKDIYNNLDIYDEDHTFKENQWDIENNKKVLKYFDNFNDFKASERIVNEIENLYV
jgi:hypothetical protein